MQLRLIERGAQVELGDDVSLDGRVGLGRKKCGMRRGWKRDEDRGKVGWFVFGPC